MTSASRTTPPIPSAVLTVVAVVGILLVVAGFANETVRIVVGLGCAVVLWTSSYHLALRD